MSLLQKYLFPNTLKQSSVRYEIFCSSVEREDLIVIGYNEIVLTKYKKMSGRDGFSPIQTMMGWVLAVFLAVGTAAACHAV
jgi:hypothetical protein